MSDSNPHSVESSAPGSAARWSSSRVNVDSTALSLRWCFGFNSSSTLVSTIHSLTTPNRSALFYVSAHTGVIHDLEHDTQYLLQGHCNAITAVCVSHDKRWIATADSGPDSMIVIWDSHKAAPVKIIPQKDTGGIIAMDMSVDAMFLVTLTTNTPQTLSVWEWPSNSKTPAITAPVGEAGHDYQHCVRFNPVDVRDIVTNGHSKVIFWNWSEDTIAAFHPPKGVSKLKKAIGHFTQTTFIPYTTKAVTSTSSGHIISWDYPVSELVQSTGRDAIKILKIVKCGIRLLDTVLDKFIVCGCDDGAVRFFDFQFRVVAWFEDIAQGMITSISFAEGQIPLSAPTVAGQVTMEEFFVPDFIVGTSSGKIIQLDSKVMDALSSEKRRGRLLVQGFDDEVYALDSHPCLPLFAVGTLNGSLQIWDIDDRTISAQRKFEQGEVVNTNQQALQDNQNKPGTSAGGAGGTSKPGTSAGGPAANNSLIPKSNHDDTKTGEELINDSSEIRVVKFGPKGVLLAIGFANGFVKVVSSQESTYSADVPLINVPPPLRDICSFHRSQSAITHITFSSDGVWFATADAENCVAIYRYYHRDEELDKPIEWIYVGKYRAHYKTIISLFFTIDTLKQVEAEAEEKRRADEERNKAKEEANQVKAITSVVQSPKTAGGTLKPRVQAVPKETPRPVPGQPVLPRLFSLGEDRILQEYDLSKSSIRSGLKMKSSCKIDQFSCPTAMMSMPGKPLMNEDGSLVTSPGAENKPLYSPDLIITANDEYKMKIWELIERPPTTQNSRPARKPQKTLTDEDEKQNGEDGVDDEKPEEPADKICHKTLLAPTYGAPINSLFILPKREASTAATGSSTSAAAAAGAASGGKIVPSDFLVYSTAEKIVGLIKLPLDGNPNKSMALIAHPSIITAVCCSYDGKYLITAGGNDRSVNLWAINTYALEASIALGGQGIDPYMSLIAGGRDGEFYQELLDYFYYSQLRSQGLSTTNHRRITGLIPISEVINLIRALGFYPTEQQIKDITNEIHYENSRFLRSTNQDVTPDRLDRVNLQEFIKLYVNHRPVASLNKQSFESSFITLSHTGDESELAEDLSIDTEILVQKLLSYGERMTESELLKCIDSLLGETYIPSDRNTALDYRDDLSATMKAILSRLPLRINPTRFAQELLGFEDYATQQDNLEKERARTATSVSIVVQPPPTK